jgi:hypothetical protein
MDCLIIKKEYLDKIFSGKKTWEIRGFRTHKRGKIGLIQSGSGEIIGECEIVDCSKELTLEEYLKNKHKHCSNNSKLNYKKTFAWILKNPKRYSEPIKYKHPMGAIIWVKI